jgi:hypothetical protein
VRQQARLGSMRKKNVTRCSGVTTSPGGEVASGRRKGGDDVSWFDANLIGPKIKKIHVVDSIVINVR